MTALRARTVAFVDTLAMALATLGANPLRSLLTLLGIVIGAASVIVMLALGNGARAAVDANFRSLGANELQISERRDLKNGELVSTGKQLTFDDGLNLPRAVPEVDRVDMFVSGAAHVRYGRNSADVNFIGVTADYPRSEAASGTVQPVRWPEGKVIQPADFIGEGRFFTPVETLDGSDICVLGWQTAQDLFEGDEPLNETVWVNRRPCTVIGVLAELELTDPQERYTARVNDGIYLPISTAIREQFQKEPSVTIQAYVKDPAKIQQTKFAVAQALRQRHAIEPDSQGVYKDDFDVITRDDLLGAQLEAARTFSLLLAAMAVVSLVVGGIGIMNVMLVSVTERTREIGIRLAVGAQPVDVVSQFLLEAIVISAAGGLAGLVAGILAIPAAASLNQGVALLEPDSLPLAFGVAVLTGIVFGLYPALRAANLSPIEALRYE